jgi:hypothetical protein
MGIENMDLSTRGNLAQQLRDIANAIESKRESCIITRTTSEDKTSIYRIITGFWQDAYGYSPLLTEVTISYPNFVSPKEE